MKKIHLRLMLIVGMSLIAGISSAEAKTIRGRVMMQTDTIEPVIGAMIKIESTVMGAKSDKKGNFVIKNVPDGNFTLIITSIGMETIKFPVEIKKYPGEEINLDFSMKDDPIQTSCVVVSANRIETLYDESPVKVSSMTKEEIASTNSNTLKECLNYRPGVRTETNCQDCGLSQVRINGMEGKYSSILIDGKAIYSSLNSVYGLDQIPTEMIDSLEIIRGGGSTLFGSNAIAGTVNIITKEPEESSYSAEMKSGYLNSKIPYQTLTFGVNAVNYDGDMGMSLFGTVNQRGAFDANGDGITEITRMNADVLGGKLFLKLSPRQKISGEFHLINHELRGGNKLDLEPFQADDASWVKTRTESGQISYDLFFNQKSKFSVYAAYQSTKRNSYYGTNRDTAAFGNTDNRTYAGGASISSFVDNFLGYHFISGGIDVNYDEISDKAPAYDRDMFQVAKSVGIFIGDDWDPGKGVSILWGARLEKHNMVSDAIISPRAAVKYKLAKDLNLRASIATGYRAPQTFDEDLHVSIVGGERMIVRSASGLKPEYSVSYNTSAEYSFEMFNMPFAVSAEYFQTDLRDAFALEDAGTDHEGNRILLRKNSDGAVVQGMTIEMQTRIINKVAFKTGFTAQSAKYDNEVVWSDETGAKSDKIFRSPSSYGYFMATADVSSRLTCDISGVYTGSMYAPHHAGYIPTDVLVHTDPFFELNAKLSYEIMHSPDLVLSVGCQNIFNAYQKDFDKGFSRDADYIYGPSAPRMPYISMKISGF